MTGFAFCCEITDMTVHISHTTIFLGICLQLHDAQYFQYDLTCSVLSVRPFYPIVRESIPLHDLHHRYCFLCEVYTETKVTYMKH